MLRKKSRTPRKTNSVSGRGVLTITDPSYACLLRRVQRLERELAFARRSAYYDPLTGLPNRALMLDRLRQALAQAMRQRKAVGLLLLDLDDFKIVNDDLGHGVGELERVRQKTLEQLSEPHRFDGRVVVVHGSIGGALFGRDAESCESLIAAADADMYRVKRLRAPGDLAREHLGESSFAL